MKYKDRFRCISRDPRYLYLYGIGRPGNVSPVCLKKGEIFLIVCEDEGECYADYSIIFAQGKLFSADRKILYEVSERVV